MKLTPPCNLPKSEFNAMLLCLAQFGKARLCALQFLMLSRQMEILAQQGFQYLDKVSIHFRNTDPRFQDNMRPLRKQLNEVFARSTSLPGKKRRLEDSLQTFVRPSALVILNITRSEMPLFVNKHNVLNLRTVTKSKEVATDS